MSKFILVLTPIFLLIFIYVFFFLKRAFSCFSVDVKKPWKRVTLFVLSVLITALSCDISSAFAVFVLHVMFVDGILRLIALFFRKITFPPVLKKLFGSGLCAVLIAGAVLFAGCINFFSVRPTEYEIFTEKELRDEGYRVVLIADVHYGVSLDYDELLEKCAEISATEPDVVVLCGDIVDNSTTAEGMREVFRAFGTIESRFGIYYTYGNHDRSMKMLSNRFGDNELEKTITENGIKILCDETEIINGELALVGREDRSRDRLPVSELEKDIDESNFVLVLDHQPSDYSANANAKTDLVVSGHTHGGQFFPIDILQKIVPFNDGVYGLYDLDENTKAIVTSGFAGWAYPSKTSAPSEYAVIDIKSK